MTSYSIPKSEMSEDKWYVLWEKKTRAMSEPMTNIHALRLSQ
jgi:hypothetical protein